jgi:membrane protease YdiL (CAAX protease family)
MNDAATGFSSLESRTRLLAIVSSAVWLGAATSAGAVGVWRALGSTAVALGLAVLLLGRPASTALLRPSPGLIWLGAAAGGVMAVATYAFYPVVARLAPMIHADTARLYEAFRAPSPLVASLALGPVVLGEELVWRGAVQGSLALRFGPERGAVLAAVVYALAHLPLGSPVLVAVAFMCGLVWGLLRVRTASLVPALVAHLVWDLLVLLWLPLDGQ